MVKLRKMTLITKKEILMILSVFVLFFIPLLASANLNGTSEDIILKTNPQIPIPNKILSLNLNSGLTNLGTSEIAWYKNNVLQSKGYGEKSFSFVVGNTGSSDIITAVILTQGGKTFTKRIVFRPAEVDLLWESDSTVPPFYEGKALVSKQSMVKIVAVPNIIDLKGNKINPKNLVYRWKKNWEVLGGFSGLGKNIYLFDSSKTFKNNLITVEVQTLDGRFKASQSVMFSFHRPKIVFYKSDPLLGIMFGNAIVNNFNLSGDEATFFVQPFFFSKSDVFNNLKWKWSMNGKEIKGQQGVDMLTFKRPENKGFASIELNIQNVNRFLQFAAGGFKISFGEDKKSNVSF